MNVNRRWRVVAAIVVIVVTGLLMERSPIEATGPGAERTKVLVELFTSEGCSSCPPADAVLARLVDQQPVDGVEIIAMSEHVDYWNQLGWSDPFSDAQFSARQREYARVLGSGVYTPQMVVDGQTEFVGSSIARAIQAASRAGQTTKATVGISRIQTAADRVQLKVQVERPAALGRDDPADIYLAVTESNLSSYATRGENRGRRLTHIGVVRRLSVIGRMTEGSPFVSTPIIAIAPQWKPADVRVVVFAQASRTMRVLGASSAPLIDER